MGPIAIGFLVGLTLTTACTDSSSPADGGGALLVCYDGTFGDATSTAIIAFRDRAATMAECLTADDCTKLEPQLNCPDRDVRIVGCSVPIASAREADFEAALTDVASELCGRIERGCHTTPSCEDPPLVCTDGTCRAPGVYSP